MWKAPVPGTLWKRSSDSDAWRRLSVVYATMAGAMYGGRIHPTIVAVACDACSTPCDRDCAGELEPSSLQSCWGGPPLYLVAVRAYARLHGALRTVGSSEAARGFGFRVYFAQPTANERQLRAQLIRPTGWVSFANLQHFVAFCERSLIFSKIFSKVAERSEQLSTPPTPPSEIWPGAQLGV
jgi:hypothetical protein